MPFVKSKRIIVSSILLLVIIVACDNSESRFNCVESDLTLELDAVGMASGCDSFDGSIQVTAVGGKEPYSYSLDELVYQSSGLFPTVNTGIYTVSVKDGHGCIAYIDNVNVEAEGFSVSTQVTADNVCIGGDGSVTILVTGGTEPFNYKLEDGLFSDINVFTNLDRGKHQVTVKDDSDCTVKLNITIPHGETGVSWSGDVLPIIQTKCALPGCHNGATRPDLRLYSKAYFYREYIKDLTRTRAMPFNDETLTQTQIELITCWVDDGAPEN